MQRTKKTDEKISLILKSLRCCSAVAPLSLRCRSTAVATDVVTQSLLLSPPFSLRCCSTVTMMLLRCHSAVAPLLLSCCSAVALLPLLSICSRSCRFCCCYAITAAISPAVTPLSLLLSLCCRSTVALVSLRYRSVISPPSLHCCSAAADVTPAVAPAVPTQLLLL